MRRKIFKFALLLVVLVFTAIPLTARATEETYAESIVLVENADGLYEITNSNSRTGIRATARDGGQIYDGDSDALFMRVDNNLFMRAEELFIDAQNYLQFETIANRKQLSSPLRTDVEEIMTRVLKGEIELEEPLAIYIPEPIESKNTSRSITTTTKTYTGYAGKQYYQELLDCKGNSKEFDVIMPSSQWSQYCGQVFESAVITSASAGLDAISSGTWTLLSVFLHTTSDSISTSQAYTHTAKLFENKYIKYTYLVQNGEYYIGSVIDYAYKYFFRNFINVDGEDFYSDGDTANFYAKAAGYDSADEYAYRYYLNSSYNNSISRYNYRNSTKGINTYVDSLF